MNLFDLIKNDAFRYIGNKTFLNIVKLYLQSCGFRYTVWLRVANFCRFNKFVYFFPWCILTHLKYKYGIDIPAQTKISPGFYIGHFGGIVISSNVVIGRNVNISQGVTLGFQPRGKNKGYPIIGDNVYIGPGSVIFGDIVVGNNVVIGANSIVNRDLSSNSTYAGNPAKKISDIGAEDMLNFVQIELK
jgi:serine O-acetyltransferase